MENDMAEEREDGREPALPSPDPRLGIDWHTKMVRIENAKAIRRETQKARKGKPVAFSRP